MFKNIYYDARTNKMHLWETIDGKVKKIEEYVEHPYYLDDRTGKSEIKDIYGTPVVKKTTTEPKSLSVLRQTGVKTYETNIRPAMQFLQNRYGGKTLKPNVKDFNIAYIDIEVRSGDAEDPEDWKPERHGCEINLISVKSSKTNRMVTFGTEEYKCVAESEFVEDYYYCKDEEVLCRAFIAWWRKQKFDVITGWNTDFYDVPYILNRFRHVVGEEETRKLSPMRKIDFHRFRIIGIAVLDYLALYKTYTYVTRPSYTLNYIGVHEVGMGKIDLDGQIQSIYDDDWELFTDYNIQDVLIVEALDKKLKLIELVITFAYETLIPIENVSSSVALGTGAILKKLHSDGMVMPDKVESEDWWTEEKMYRNGSDNPKHWQNWAEGDEESQIKVVDGRKVRVPATIYGRSKGGHVEANAGFYKYNLSYDITSEYPHMIIQYNISPETKVIKPTPEMIEEQGLIKSQINGVYYKPGRGILPEIVQYFFNKRKEYKKKMFEAEKAKDKEMQDYYNSMQMIYKILINSMYGILLNEHFPLSDVDNARAITRGGRVLIRHLGKTTNDYFQKFWHKTAKKYFPDTDFGKNPNDRIEKSCITVIDTDSVIGSTIIKTSDGEKTIESIYDEYATNVKESYKDNFIGEVNGLKSLSFNTTKEIVENNKITYIKKHLVNKRMFEIEFEGKNVTVTEDHSVIVKRDGKYLDLSPLNILETDELIKIK